MNSERDDDVVVGLRRQAFLERLWRLKDKEDEDDRDRANSDDYRV